jgi:hypothetical protein
VGSEIFGPDKLKECESRKFNQDQKRFKNGCAAILTNLDFRSKFSEHVFSRPVPKCHFRLSASPKCHFRLLASKKRQIKTFSPRHYRKTPIESVTKIFTNQRKNTRLHDNLECDAEYAIFRVYFWVKNGYFFGICDGFILRSAKMHQNLSCPRKSWCTVVIPSRGEEKFTCDGVFPPNYLQK